MNEFVITKSLRDYKNPSQIAHKVLADRIAAHKIQVINRPMIVYHMHIINYHFINCMMKIHFINRVLKRGTQTKEYSPRT